MQKNILYDLSIERVVIGYLFQYGIDVLLDIEDSISKNDFYDSSNQSIYECLRYAINETGAKSVTLDSVLTAAKNLNLHSIINEEQIDFLKQCKQQNINKEELPQFLRQLKFWGVVRTLKGKCGNIEKYLGGLSGQESVLDIAARAEEEIFNFIPNLVGKKDITDMGQFAEDYAKYLEENPVEIIGLPTGFSRYDKCIGGGLRKGTVNIVGGRPKSGKSFFCLNVAQHLVQQHIPVLYLDTELNRETQTTRWLSLNAKIDVDKIETGQFAKNPQEIEIIKKTVKEIKNLPFDHINIAGQNIQETLSLMRRWLHQRVGKDNSGNTKDCLIILDYIKTMDLKDLGNFAEHQYLGDLTTKMHNFAVNYSIPMFATVQLNRDGITRDSSDIVSGSDRILWLCTSLAVIKNKTPEDYAGGDSKQNGDRKLIIIDCRNGPGLDVSNEYINVKSNLQRSEMIEGQFNYENTDSNLLYEDLDDETPI